MNLDSSFLQANDVADTKIKVFNNENEIPKNFNYYGANKEPAADSIVPVDKFKAFNVIENDSKNVFSFDNESEKMDSINNISSFR